MNGLTPKEELEERQKNRDHAALLAKRTMIAGVVGGLFALAGGVGKDAIETLKSKEEKPAYALQVVNGPIAQGTRAGVVRFDSKKGATWYARENAKGDLEWVLIGDSSAAAATNPTATPASPSDSTQKSGKQ
jgi:hypothetical protein